MIGQPKLASPVDADLSPRLPHGDLGEYYRTVLRSLNWPTGADAEPRGHDDATEVIRTLGVTSCARREGVSTIAAHLAATAAQMDAGNVLLVDANLACPVVHDLFDVDLSPGLVESAANPSAMQAFLQPSGYEHLEILTAGEPEGKLSGAAFDSAGISRLIADIERTFRLVVFDMPPAGEQSATLRLAGMLDAVIIVVEAERVRYEVARRAKELLERAGARVRGAVLNKRRDYVPRWLYGSL